MERLHATIAGRVLIALTDGTGTGAQARLETAIAARVGRCLGG